MSDRTDREFLSDIVEAIGRIQAYVAGMTCGAFLEDIKTQDAVVRNLEIIGEAAKNLSEDVRQRYSTIPWRSMAAVRDRLIHHYFGVNLEVVWEIAAVELEAVAEQVEQILNEMQAGG